MSSVQEKPSTSAVAVEEPYVGLTHFTEDYADRFFGRERESDVIVGNLQAARLTLLYAESGVGKSSVLRAGVVAYLRELAEDLRDPGALHLVPVVFSAWSERPVAELIGEIGRTVRPYLDRPEELELPENDLAGALEAAGKALDATLLVVLDQFEEYFLYPDEAPEQDRIAAQIARCVNRPDLRANFLISIRQDSYARLGDLFRGKVRNVYRNFLHLDFLDRAGGREAIEGPIERVNEKLPRRERFKVEPPLVDVVIDQVEHDEDEDKVETTYLQLVMRRLWEEERKAGSRVLRLQTLERLGGAQKIISDHLDRAMEGAADGSDALDDEQRVVAAKIFRHLVTSGGTKIALTARELADYTEIPVEKIEPVLRHLSSSKLHILRPVVSGSGEGEQRFEIFHDALAAPINSWRAQVEDKERERERAEKEAAQRAAARAERRARVAQALLAVAVVALIAGALVFAIQQKDLADQREADNQSVRAAERIAEIARAPTFGPPVAALASVEDYRLSGTVEARNQALAQLQLNPGLPKIAVGHTHEALTVAYLPGSRDFASGAADGTIRLWNARGGEIGSPLITIDTPVGLAIGKPSDGARILAAGLEGGGLDLWRLTGSRHPRHLRRLRVGSGKVWGVAFNPRVPSMLAVASQDGAVTLWNLKDPRHPVKVGQRAEAGRLSGLAFAADGRTLFVAGDRGGVALGVAGKGFAAAQPVRLSGGNEAAVATAPNGSYAFGGKKGIVLWDAARGRHLHLRPPGEVVALEFADEGSVLVSAGTDRSVTTWDVASGRPFGPPRAFEKAAEDVAVSSDGRTVVAAGEDGLVKAWPLRPQLALATTVGSLGAERAGALPEVDALAVGEGGRAVAAAAGPAGTSIWPLRPSPAPSSLPRPVADIPGTSYAVAYRGDVLVTGTGNSFAVYGTGAACPEDRPKPCLLATPRRPYSQYPVTGLALERHGRRLLLASSGYRQGEGVNLWDLTDAIEGGAVLHRGWQPVGGAIRRIALSPTEPLLAVGSENGKLQLWDVGDPRAPEEIELRHPSGSEKQPIDAVAFSPDGSLLASGGEDQQVVLWRVVRQGSGPPTVKAIPGTLVQGQSIFSLGFSPDGKTLAAGDSEGSTCLYEVASRHLIGDACLRGERSERQSFGGTQATEFAGLSDGSTALLTAGAGPSIVSWNSILWNLSGDDGVENEIAKYACALAGRDLNGYEWGAIFNSTKLAGDLHPICRE